MMGSFHPYQVRQFRWRTEDATTPRTQSGLSLGIKGMNKDAVARHCAGSYNKVRMARCRWALGVLLFSGAALAQSPSYTAASIVNASDFSTGPFAPGSLISIFGTSLSFNTAGLSAGNTESNQLPLMLGNVQVLIANMTAPLLYVSPTQINLMIPSILTPGNVALQVLRQGVVGPAVTLPLVAAAPAPFVSSDHFVVAQDYNARYALATASAPAKPGDLIVLYATGLGGTQPLPATGEIPQSAAYIVGFSSGALQVLLNGKAIDPSTIPYAGLTPGFGGLYQINFFLPGDCPPNPQIQIAMGAQLSPPNMLLAVAASQ